MRWLAALFVLVLTGCSVPKPVIDLKSVQDPVAYQRDLVECRILAEQGMSPDAPLTEGAMTGTALGGAAGTISAAAQGQNVASGAATGMAGGAVGAAMGAEILNASNIQRTTGRCLENRGYAVLNRREMAMTHDLWCWHLVNAGASMSREQFESCKEREKERSKRLGYSVDE